MDDIHWPKVKNLQAPAGIVIASDLTQEWLLPWWWENYTKHNSFPVTFVDIGLSQEMQAWCQERGHYIPLNISDFFVQEKDSFQPEHIEYWEKKYGTFIWDNRGAWFKKPFACLQSPYTTAIWMDSDCEVRGSLAPLFSNPLGVTGLRIGEESPDKNPTVNSGVIVFSHGSPLIQDWARESVKKNNEYVGDQDILYTLLKKHWGQATDLPLEYNWSRFRGENSEAKVIHWHGRYGKAVIEHQIFKKNMEIFDCI